jgi:non-specific protein-tyrosine kinase
MAEYLGIEGAAGLTSVLVGRVELDHVLQPWGGDIGLTVLPSGPIPPNPAELLASRALGSVLRRLEAQFDLVLVDAPPLLPVTDGAVLAAATDGALLVVRSQKVKREQVRQAMEGLHAVDARLLGIVMNMIPTRGPDARSYTRGYGYESQPPSPTATESGRVPGRPMTPVP